MSGSALASVRVWAEMVKLPHSVFALPFAVMAAFLAGREIPGRGWPYVGQLGFLLVCMVAARSVAMTFNRIADAEIDTRNPRTSDRPLPTGRLSRQTAWAMLAVSAGLFIVGCLGFYVVYGNAWPVALCGPVLLFLCGYSYSKRLTQWSHFYLGTALALSPVAAWLAIHPASVGLPVILLMMAVTTWVAGFDIIYSCQDIEIDRRDGLFSLPSRLGAAPALWIARGCHAVSIAALAAVGVAAELGNLYALGVMLAAALLVVENSLVHPGDYRRVNLAFFALNGVVSVIVGTLAVVDTLLSVPA